MTIDERCATPASESFDSAAERTIVPAGYYLPFHLKGLHDIAQRSEQRPLLTKERLVLGSQFGAYLAIAAYAAIVMADKTVELVRQMPVLYK